MARGGASVFPFPAVPNPTTGEVPREALPSHSPLRVVRAIFPNRIRKLPHCSIWYDNIFQLQGWVVFGILCSLTAREIFYILSEYFGKVHKSLRLSRFMERVEVCPSIISTVLWHKFEVGGKCLPREVMCLMRYGVGQLIWCVAD